ncbi:MAG: hypothetical protein TE42_08350 [Candidatus Synechococcus spongiarum SP3]|uniref:Uncharacterized protein n=1 Tax=Candidatus Synechococcus spongiarum SP3 TaxID=1604020 RepID=A0A0G2IVS4_9SYNE|nr:MAG: hypothetical protein TE42_08350 [Candidatus Synechococcus spongiarum SP3]
MLDALPVPLPLLLAGLGGAALVAGVVVVWTRGRGSGDKAFAEFGSDASPGVQQTAPETSEPTFEPLPAAPAGDPEPMVVANFAPDQLSLGITVPAGRRRPGASMKPFKEMADSMVTKG